MLYIMVMNYVGCWVAIIVINNRIKYLLFGGPDNFLHIWISIPHIRFILKTITFVTNNFDTKRFCT